MGRDPFESLTKNYSIYHQNGSIGAELDLENDWRNRKFRKIYSPTIIISLFLEVVNLAGVI